jgi:archaemetzincin
MKLNLRIKILPIGEIGPKSLRILQKDLEGIFSTVEILEPISIIQTAFNPGRNQYLASKFLSQVKKTQGDHILGVTEVDLYTPDLNFVFGQAQLPGKAAVISLNRLHTNDHSLFRSRMVKEAVHELGHTLGLRHCPDIHCVMHFSNSLMDTDIKAGTFCENCQKILCVI